MDEPRGVERRPALAPVATPPSPTTNQSRTAEGTVTVLRGARAKLSSAHMERIARRQGELAVFEEEEEEEEEEAGTGVVGEENVHTPPQDRNGGVSTEITGRIHENDAGYLVSGTDRRKQTPPLPSLVRNGADVQLNSATPSGRPRSGSERDSPLSSEPNLETKKAWKTRVIERLANMERGKTPATLERSDSDVSTSTVFSLEDFKRRIAERTPIAMVVLQRRTRNHILKNGAIYERRNSMPPDSSNRRRSRSRSLTSNTNTSDSASQRRSSSSSDPLSSRTDRRHSGELISKVDGSMSTSSLRSGVGSPLPEEVTEDGKKAAGMSAGVAMYERRRSAAASMLDVNGNLSYASRKSLRRGSVADGKLAERPTRPRRVSDSSQESQTPAGGGGDRRQSLTPAAGRRRASMDIASPGSSLLPGDACHDRPSQLGLQLGRRRRSRAPASLAEDIATFAAKQEKRISGLKRFRRIAKVVVLCISMCRKSYLRAEKEKEVYMSFESTSGLLGGQRLLFDPAYFKADRQQRLSEETKRILNLPPEGRTDDLIKYVEIALRNIRAFAQYPKRMQHMLCKVGWLEEYESKRAILRQGHLPHAFYFILSGEVVVTVLDTKKGKRVAETVAILKRGESFGELAILNRTRRASTVISQDRVELLVISVEDFEEIFMLSGGIKKVNDPDQHAFLTSLTCLKHWPLQLIEQHPQECRFHFFKDGNVLIKDSLLSDWIYIIKSGSCSVLKKLKRVAPSIPSRLKRKTSPLMWNSGIGQALPTTEAGPCESRTASPSMKKQRRHKRNHTWPAIPRRPGGRERTGAAVDDSTARLRSPAGGRSSRNMADGSAVSKLGKRSLQANSKKGVYLTTSRDDSRIATSNMESRILTRPAETEQKSDDENSVESNTTFIQRRREFHSDLDSSRTPVEKTEADIDPMFVVVQVLTKGAVFGLTGVVFSDQPSLSLVSNGAECIVINKKFYLEHATDETLRRLRKEEVPYPSEKELQNKLQQYMNWNAYRHHTFYTTLYESRDHKTERVTVLKPMLYR